MSPSCLYNVQRTHFWSMIPAWVNADVAEKIRKQDDSCASKTTHPVSQQQKQAHQRNNNNRIFEHEILYNHWFINWNIKQPWLIFFFFKGAGSTFLFMFMWLLFARIVPVIWNFIRTTFSVKAWSLFTNGCYFEKCLFFWLSYTSI